MVTLHKNASLFIALALTCCVLSLQAQITGGFKTGLNFATFKGPAEIDDAGKNLETWQNITGFHIGATFAYNFTDNFGLRGELMYSKKGAKYTYEGQSFRIFNYSGDGAVTTGAAKYLININNAYVDIPVVAFAKVGRFEFSGGVYASLLIQSLGEGSLNYSYYAYSTQPGPANPLQELKFNLAHNYRRDDPGEGKGNEIIKAVLNSGTIEMPKTIGAYFEETTDRGNLFKGVDYGLIGGLNYYLSHSLYAGVRLQYGLADITNNKADVGKARLTADSGGVLAPATRDDKDRNFVIQASVGFSF